MAASTLVYEASYVSSRRNIDWRWALICGAAFFPVAAILHHAVFYATTCMLNPFGLEYSASTVAIWLSKDPSPSVAAVLILGLHRWGRSFRLLHSILAVFAIAFLPLALYVWDIPGTGRWICDHFHDLKFALPGGMPLRGRHLYFLGAALFPLIYLTHLLRSRVGSGFPANASFRQLPLPLGRFARIRN